MSALATGFVAALQPIGFVHARVIQRRTLPPVCFSRESFDTAEPLLRASKVPTPDEDREVAHSAFLHAFQEAQPEKVRLPGMQEFASGLLSRSRIPSQQYMDPLAHIFQEFDKDSDGHLEPKELAAALRSRNVIITDEQAQMFIDVVDLTDSHRVSQADFRELILHMAAADLHGRKTDHYENCDGEWETCSLEGHEEIQLKLGSWLDKIMAQRQA